jgi:hypothetical protein
MIITNLDVKCVTIFKAKADAPLIVDPDRILSVTITLQPLEAIARRHPQIIKPMRGMQRHQLAPGAIRDVCGQAARSVAFEELLGLLILEGSYHETEPKIKAPYSVA